jgi:AcrR family transcriptional regulator
VAKKRTTRQKVLSAACEIFAEKGFRDATVSEICATADANIASVNYHFGDKESLYDEVWRHAFDITAKAYPLDGGMQKAASLEDGLYSYASAFLHRIFSEDETGLFAKLLYREMAAPTLALDRIVNEVLLPQNQHLGDIIEKMLGEDCDEQQLRLCKNSIIGQCAFYNFSRPLREHVIGKETMSEKEIELIARHIATFSMHGLRGIQQ